MDWWTWIGLLACLPIGLPANVVILWVIIRFKRLQNAINILLANLCVSNLVCLLTSLSYIVSLRNFVWTFGDGFCKVFTLLHHASFTATYWNIVAVSLMRYLTIWYSNRFQAVKTVRIAIGLSIGLWVVCFILFIDSLFVAYVWEPMINGTNPFNISLCIIHSGSRYPINEPAIYTVIFLIDFLLPSVAVTVLNGLMIYRVRVDMHVLRTMSTRSQMARINLMFVVIIVSFIGLTAPYFIAKLALAVALQRRDFNQTDLLIASIRLQCLIYIPMAISPLLYSLFQHDFQTALAGLWPQCLRCNYKQTLAVHLEQTQPGDRHTDTEMDEMPNQVITYNLTRQAMPDDANS